MPNTPEEVKRYLASIGRKGGQASKSPLKYPTEQQRLQARRDSQKAYRARVKEKGNEVHSNDR